MKKSLLATTALAALGAVAVAGPAAAAEKISIGVGGYMEQWFGYADNKDSAAPDRDGFDQQTDAEIHFKGETTLDNGLTIGVNVQLEAQTDGDQIDEQYLYVEGSFCRFLMGSENSASYLMHYGIPIHGATIDSGDVTGWIAGTDFTMARTNGRGIDNDSEKLTYFTPRFAGFQVGVSYVPQHNQDADAPPQEANGVRDDGFAVAANFNRSFNDFSVKASAGYQDFGDDDLVSGDLESYQFGLQLGYAGFVLAGTYGEEDRAVDDEQETIGIGLSYATGPFGVSLAYIGAERDAIDDQQDAFELGAKYALGPGVDVKGSVYYAEREIANNDVAEGFAIVGGLDLSF
ncbi:MAG: porin [Alphaproteobacteria bacterium]